MRLATGNSPSHRANSTCGWMNRTGAQDVETVFRPVELMNLLLEKCAILGCGEQSAPRVACLVTTPDQIGSEPQSAIAIPLVRRFPPMRAGGQNGW
jgi:hypothetical protein